jgi:hypothetical protein
MGFHLYGVFKIEFFFFSGGGGVVKETFHPVGKEEFTQGWRIR